MALSEREMEAAHRHCGRNREALSRSRICSCFHCLQVYAPREIEEWIDGDQTARCAKCGIDSVIGSDSGLPVSDDQFLAAMHQHWFAF